MSRNQECLLDIVNAARLVIQYAENQEFSEFSDNVEKQDAILRRITIIGEATKRLTLEFSARYSEVPWREMAGIRDVIIHDYDEIDLQEIWTVIKEDLPQILHLLENIETDSMADDTQESH